MATILAPGKSATATIKVTNENTARALGSGGLEVFSTPMMMALMEQAACNALADALEAGQTSVGTKISVEHTAASPVGAQITATATVVSPDGRMVEFEVTAKDGAGEIGKGTHTRAIVDPRRLLAKANKRL